MTYIRSKTKIIDENNYKKNYIIEKSIDDYIEYINLQNAGSNTEISQMKKNTYHRRKSDLKKFKDFIKKNYEIKYTIQINNEIIDNYAKYIYSLKKKNGDDFSQNSKVSFFTSFKSYMSRLAELSCIKKESYVFLENSNYFTQNKKDIQSRNETGYLTPAQIQNMFKNLEKYYKNCGDYRRNRSIFLLLLHGFRIGEILNLKWGDINFKNNTAYIRREKTNVSNTVYLSKETISQLKEYKDSLNINFKANFAYCFCGKTVEGKKCIRKVDLSLSQKAVTDIIKKISKDELDSKGKIITARTFRKTFAVSNMLCNNKLIFIQTYTKHTLTVLQKHYSEFIENSSLNAEESLENYFDFITSKKRDKLKDVTVEDILRNDKLREELRIHFTQEFLNAANILRPQ